MLPFSWFLFVLLLGLAATVIMHLLSRGKRVRTCECGRCGYDLSAAASLICPECGSDLRACGILVPGYRRLSPLRFLAGIPAIALLAFAAWWIAVGTAETAFRRMESSRTAALSTAFGPVRAINVTARGPSALLVGAERASVSFTTTSGNTTLLFDYTDDGGTYTVFGKGTNRRIGDLTAEKLASHIEVFPLEPEHTRELDRVVSYCRDPRFVGNPGGQFNMTGMAVVSVGNNWIRAVAGAVIGLGWAAFTWRLYKRWQKERVQARQLVSALKDGREHAAHKLAAQHRGEYNTG